MEYKYTGIILNKKDVGETDRFYTLYTLEMGKIKSLAKGVRKAQAKLAGSLETITLSDITIAKSRGMGKITGSIAENNYVNIKNNCDALLEVFKSFSIFNKLVDFESKDIAVFNLLVQYLDSMERLTEKEIAKEQLSLISCGFIVKLLHTLGYGIEVRYCSFCGGKISDANIYFSSKSGGVICTDCRKKVNQNGFAVSANVIKTVRIFLANNISSLSKLKLDKKELHGVNMILQDFLRWNT